MPVSEEEMKRRITRSECENRLTIPVRQYRERKKTAESLLDDVLGELYRVATLVPVWEAEDFHLNYGRSEGNAVLLAILMCIFRIGSPVRDLGFDDVRSLRAIAPPIPLPEQNAARPLFLACKDAELPHLQEIDEDVIATSGISLLQNPRFRHLLVVVALIVGNKPLATSIIETYPPGPDHDTIFSPRFMKLYRDRETGLNAHSHAIYASIVRKDTGCDVWVTLLKHGWASPRLCMLSAGLTSPDIPSGKALIQELLPAILANKSFPEVEVSRTLWHTFHWCPAPELVDAYLTLFNPRKRGLPNEARYLARAAAYAEGSATLKVLHQHDAGDFFAMEEHEHEWWESVPLDEPPYQCYGYTRMSTALHHAARACNVEAVEFLLSLPGGNVPRRDGYGRTAYDFLKHLEEMKQVEALLSARHIYAVFESLGWRLSSKEEIEAAASPLRRTKEYTSSNLSKI